MDCIFCKIVSGEIPSTKVYEDDMILAFQDLSPQAPVHFLVIPKAHIADMNEVAPKNAGTVAHIFAKIPEIMTSLGVQNGYRVVSNCGSDGGQTVGHLHFHCLAGRLLSWPPG